MLGGWHFPTSIRDQQAWFASLSCQSDHQRFAIEVRGHGLVGTANHADVPARTVRAEVTTTVQSMTAMRGRIAGAATDQQQNPTLAPHLGR